MTVLGPNWSRIDDTSRHTTSVSWWWPFSDLVVLHVAVPASFALSYRETPRWLGENNGRSNGREQWQVLHTPSTLLLYHTPVTLLMYHTLSTLLLLHTVLVG
jgi:hypothetical protein